MNWSNYYCYWYKIVISTEFKLKLAFLNNLRSEQTENMNSLLDFIDVEQKFELIDEHMKLKKRVYIKVLNQ